MAERILFSDEIDKLLKLLRPYGRPETAFPTAHNITDTRRNSGETLHQWFVRFVDKYCSGDPKQTAIEPNIALLAKCKWDKNLLGYASLSTLVAQCALGDYYREGTAEAVYFRLDLNYETLGKPFSHPLVHIHGWGEHDPLFSLDGGTNGNIVVDFLEFVYRNYVPNKWLKWARSQWLSTQKTQKDEDSFDLIERAFGENQFDILKQQTNLISRIKRVLREAKDQKFTSHMLGADREILEYPLAR